MQVAIKLIIPSPHTAAMIARFRQERQILASLDHPNIARLLDGGITEEGWPYFVMEFVDGQPIHRWCDERRLNISQRIELFSGVITARYVDPGHLIPQQTAPSSANTPIVAMATLSPLRVYAEMPQSVAPFIRDGDPVIVTVTEYPGRKFEGSVTRHPQALTSATRTMLVEVDLPNQEVALLPGMYASMELNVTTPVGAPTVPDDALIFRDGKPYVPVVRNGRLKLAGVTLGYDNGINVQITDGITPDDMVALNVGQSARDGDLVRPITAAQLQN